VVITASNHPELLDRAVWRRFQVRLALEKPSPGERLAFLTQLLSSSPGILPNRVESLNRELSGSTFADVEELATDIQRKVILSGPEADLRLVVKRALTSWKERAKANALRAR
jgi:SpoVK/Ycf46/Vps4 family AAA+-type ATPase